MSVQVFRPYNIYFESITFDCLECILHSISVAFPEKMGTRITQSLETAVKQYCFTYILRDIRH